MGTSATSPRTPRRRKTRTDRDRREEVLPSPLRVLPDKKKVVTSCCGRPKTPKRSSWPPTPTRGEAIGWHIAEILRGKKLVQAVQRILFNEITRKAVQEAIHHGGPIDGAMVEAQETRRILDRIVRLRLRPARTRSAAGCRGGPDRRGRMIVGRENEIRAFRTTRTGPSRHAEPRPRAVRGPAGPLAATRSPGRRRRDVRIAALPDEAAAAAVRARRGAPLRDRVIEASARRAPRRAVHHKQAAAEAGAASASRCAHDVPARPVRGEGDRYYGLSHDTTCAPRPPLADEALPRARTSPGLRGDYMPPQPRTFRHQCAQDAHEGYPPTSTENTPRAGALPQRGRVEAYT